jgi:hypothetical protein
MPDDFFGLSCPVFSNIWRIRHVLNGYRNRPRAIGFNDVRRLWLGLPLEGLHRPPLDQDHLSNRGRGESCARENGGVTADAIEVTVD